MHLDNPTQIQVPVPAQDPGQKKSSIETPSDQKEPLKVKMATIRARTKDGEIIEVSSEFPCRC
jgi:hypothetical protein